MHEPEAVESITINREKVIIRTSLIGIGINILLAGFKAIVGALSNSIAIVLDAVNNLSDAISSVVTIIGTKLSGRSPDRKHPLGHGRIEYLIALIVSAIVLYAGLTSAIESVKKIFTPETPDYKPITLVILAVAVVVKLILGRYYKQKGKETHSASLEASGSDATFDALLSASVLGSAILFLLTGLSLEAYVGLLISAFIIKAGIQMAGGTLGDILGRRADSGLSRQIKKVLNEEKAVRGAYDLIVHNYGPDTNYASVHLELPDTMTVEQVDVLTRRLEARVYLETGVILTAVGVYSYNTKDDEAARIRNQVQKLALSHDWVLQIHGFHVDTAKKTMRFDAVMDFDHPSREGVEELTNEVKAVYPDYHIMVTPDIDITD